MQLSSASLAGSASCSIRPCCPLYRYLRDRFVWSLISAVGVFFLGAGASVIHGVHSLTDAPALEGMQYTFLVLGISAVLEGFSLLVALKNIVAGAQARGMGFVEYVKSGVDPTTVAVLLEDGEGPGMRAAARTCQWCLSVRPAFTQSWVW